MKDNGHTKEIRIGMIGLGSWAQDSYLPYFLAGTSGFSLESLSNCLPHNSGIELAKKYGIKSYYPSYKDMIRKEDLDAVAITTPHCYHFAQAKFALENKLHVLLDKPLALRSNQAIKLIKLANKKLLSLCVYAQRRYWDEYVYARKAITNGDLGQLIAVSGVFSQMIYPDYFSGWRCQKALSGGGILIDSGYHLLDIILWVTNLKPEVIFAVAAYDCYANDAQVSLALSLEGKIPINCLIIRGTPQNTAQEEITFYGTKGLIKIERNKLFGERSLYLLHLNNNGETIKQTNKTNIYSDLISPAKDFLNSIKTKQPTLSTGEDAFVTISTLEAAYRSMKINKPVRILL